jgi:hypothetical protein
VFASPNPFQEQKEFTQIERYGSMFGDALNGKQEPPMRKPSPIEMVFECSLAEFYNGANKHATFKR